MREKLEPVTEGKISLVDERLSSSVAEAFSYFVLSYGISDIGLVRQNNEDVWLEIPEIGLYMLADGMGGHQAGEVASKEAVKALYRVLKKRLNIAKQSSLQNVKEILKKSIKYVNMLIFKMGRSHLELRGMGTTLCCLLFHREGLIFAHVGDSRIYRLRGDAILQMTTDHSLLCELINQGQIDQHQASEFAYKNIITRAMGSEPKISPEINTTAIMHGDLYIMCSDGLSDLLSANEIAHKIRISSSLHDAAKELVAEANRRGGRDNITVVLTLVKVTHESTHLSR